MSRYVIELRPDCKIVQQICESNGQLYISSKGVAYLEELNSDYINEHFGDRRKAYQRGLDDAWDAARKIVLSPDEGGTSLPDLFAMFGNGSMQSVFRNYSASEAIAKLKAYEEKQKADDEIKVGDFSALIDYLSQFDESDVAKVKYIRQKIEAAIGENVDWYERRKS